MQKYVKIIKGKRNWKVVNPHQGRSYVRKLIYELSLCNCRRCRFHQLPRHRFGRRRFRRCRHCHRYIVILVVVTVVVLVVVCFIVVFVVIVVVIIVFVVFVVFVYVIVVGVLIIFVVVLIVVVVASSRFISVCMIWVLKSKIQISFDRNF